MTLAGNEAFDSVVLDLMLPDGDGTELLKRLTIDSPHTRVAVVTGVMDPQWIGRVQSFSPVCILSKPILIDELLMHL